MKCNLEVVGYRATASSFPLIHWTVLLRRSARQQTFVQQWTEHIPVVVMSSAAKALLLLMTTRRLVDALRSYAACAERLQSCIQVAEVMDFLVWVVEPRQIFQLNTPSEHRSTTPFKSSIEFARPPGKSSVPPVPALLIRLSLRLRERNPYGRPVDRLGLGPQVVNLADLTEKEM